MQDSNVEWMGGGGHWGMRSSAHSPTEVSGGGC